MLHDKNITTCIPSDFKIKHPTIIYKYTNPIRNKIFNYKYTINNIQHFDHNAQCTCLTSPYCNKDINHVITGDLNIIQHPTLKQLISYGPAYRTSTPRSYEHIPDIISSSLDTWIQKWSQREHVDATALYEWKQHILTKVHHKIKKLQRYRHTHTGITFNNDIRSALHMLHEKYVIVGADKQQTT